MTAATVAELFSVQGIGFRSLMRSAAAPFLQVAGTRVFIQLMTFITTVVLARKLGPAAFGVYTFAALVGTSLSELLFGGGADMAAVRVSAPYWHSNPERAWAVFQLVGLVKILLGLGVLLLGVVGADFIGRVLLHRPEFVVALRTAAIAVLALTLTEFGLALLQARQRFVSFAVSGVCVALGRTAPLLGLAVLSQLTTSGALTVYLCSLYLGCALALAPSWRALVSTRGQYYSIFQELFGYAGWMSLTIVFGSLMNTLDTLALTYFKGPQAVGVYAAARTFATGITVLTMASTAVLLPRFGRMTDHHARRQALGRMVYPTVGLALTVAIGMIVSAPLLIRTFYGGHYLEAIPVLQVLACAYSLELATTTLAIFFLVENRPNVLAKATAIGLLAAFGGYVWLVPRLGALGAAFVLFGGRVVSTILCLAWLVSSLSLERLHARMLHDATTPS